MDYTSYAIYMVVAEKAGETFSDSVPELNSSQTPARKPRLLSNFSHVQPPSQTPTTTPGPYYKCIQSKFRPLANLEQSVWITSNLIVRIYDRLTLAQRDCVLFYLQHLWFGRVPCVKLISVQPDYRDYLVQTDWSKSTDIHHRQSDTNHPSDNYNATCYSEWLEYMYNALRCRI